MFDEVIQKFFLMGMAILCIFNLFGLFLGGFYLYQAGIRSRKRLESRAGLLEQLNKHTETENKIADELNEELKKIGRG